MIVQDLDDYFLDIRDRLDVDILYLKYESPYRGSVSNNSILNLRDNITSRIKVLFYNNSNSERITTLVNQHLPHLDRNAPRVTDKDIEYVGKSRIDGSLIFKEGGLLIKKKEIDIIQIRDIVDNISERIHNSLNLILSYDNKLNSVYVDRVKIFKSNNTNFLDGYPIIF